MLGIERATFRRAAAALGLWSGFTASVVISLLLTREAQGVAAVWTANAFLAAALLLLPRRWGMACATLCLASNFGVYLALGDPLGQAVVFSLINSAEALTAAWATRRMCGEALRLTQLRRVARFLALAVIIPCSVAAAFASLFLATAMGKPWTAVWPSWFIADAAGLGVVLPSILILARGRREVEFHRPVFETIGLYTLLAGAMLYVFGASPVPLPFLVYSLLTLVAFRLGPRGVVYSALMALVILAPLSVWGGGALAKLVGLDAGHRVQLSQLYMLAAFYSALATATAVAGQARLKRLLQARIAGAHRARSLAVGASVAKTQFLATMSHEIRTPLNSIIGFTKLLLGSDDMPTSARRQLGLIDSAGESLLAVVNDILDFSRVEAGEVALDPHPVTIRALAEDALAIVADGAARKGLGIELEILGEADRSYMADAMRIRQVILNLLNNAVKFTDAGEVRLKVEVSASDHVDMARFSITDTGVGIPLDRRDRLFTRFSQVDGSVARTHGGAGLGLAIAKGLVELMDGCIGVRSEPGKGSTFWFEIPLSRSGAAEALTPLADDSDDVAGAHVLLVDDHPMNRELGQALLTLMGCAVDLAATGVEAVEAARTTAYDVILMDVHMPVMDGLAATRAIRALPGAPGRVPIIAMTADVLPENVERCREAGMVDHVAKPVKPDALHAALSRWAGVEVAAEAERSARLA